MTDDEQKQLHGAISTAIARAAHVAGCVLSDKSCAAIAANVREIFFLDRSVAADARRMRWLLSGNGYYMEEEMLCGHAPCSADEQDQARLSIDKAMKD